MLELELSAERRRERPLRIGMNEEFGDMYGDENNSRFRFRKRKVESKMASAKVTKTYRTY